MYPVLGGLFFQSGIFIQALLIPVFFVIRAGFEYGADAITSHTFGSDGMPGLNFAGVLMSSRLRNTPTSGLECLHSSHLDRTEEEDEFLVWIFVLTHMKIEVNSF